MGHAVSFFVAGVPKTKGNLTAIPYRKAHGGLGVRTFDKKRDTVAWQSVVQYHAQDCMPQGAPFANVPVEVCLTFYLPKTGPKKRQFPIVKPDIDKLIRNALDALTGVYFKDDAQVCELTVSKFYDTHNSGRSGMNVELRVMDDVQLS